MERTYSTAEVCKMFNLSKSTLFRWERERVSWFPPVRRNIEDERQYTTEHIEAIRQHLNKEKYRSAAKSDDLTRQRELEEQATLRKFISQRELATLHNLGERELGSETIKRLLQIALEEYSPEDEMFREIIGVIHEQVRNTAQTRQTLPVTKTKRRKGVRG